MHLSKNCKAILQESAPLQQFNKLNCLVKDDTLLSQKCYKHAETLKQIKTFICQCQYKNACAFFILCCEKTTQLAKLINTCQNIKQLCCFVFYGEHSSIKIVILIEYVFYELQFFSACTKNYLKLQPSKCEQRELNEVKTP